MVPSFCPPFLAFVIVEAFFFFIVVVVVSPPLTIVKFESSFLRPAFFQIVNSFLHFVHF